MSSKLLIIYGFFYVSGNLSSRSDIAYYLPLFTNAVANTLRLLVAGPVNDRNSFFQPAFPFAFLCYITRNIHRLPAGRENLRRKPEFPDRIISPCSFRRMENCRGRGIRDIGSNFSGHFITDKVFRHHDPAGSFQYFRLMFPNPYQRWKTKAGIYPVPEYIPHFLQIYFPVYLP